MSRFLWLLAAAIWPLAGVLVRAAEGPVFAPPTGQTSSEIAALIDQLDHPAFASRQAATDRLTQLGPLVTTQLEIAASAASREVASRAFQILKHHFQSSDEANRKAAKESLEHLSASASASTSQRARDILDPPLPAVASNRWGPPPPFPPFPAPRNNARGIMFGGNVRGGFRRISVSDVAGRKTIEIDDRERRIVIIETQPGGPLDAQVTDKQNAGNPVRKVVARDLAELRRKDVDLARIFEQYGGNNQPAAGRPAAMPPPFPAVPLPRTSPAESMRLQVQSIEAILKRYQQRAQTDAAAERMVEALKQTKTRLKSATPDIAK